MIWWIFVAAIVTAGLYYAWTRRDLYRISAQLKGPLALPFIGCAWMLIGQSHEGEYGEPLTNKKSSMCDSLPKHLYLTKCTYN